MRFASFLLSAAALVFGSARASAQPANFEGHWVQEVLLGNAAGAGGGDGGGGRGGAAGGRAGAGRGNPQGSSGFGNDFLVAQDAKVLTVRRVDTQTGDTLSATYNLDGTETKNKALFGGGSQPAENMSSVKWEGKKLVITIKGVGGGGDTGGTQNGPTTMNVSLQGKQLRIETVRAPNPNGGGGADILNFFNKAKK